MLAAFNYRGDSAKYQHVLLNVLYHATKSSPPNSTVKVHINVIPVPEEERQQLISVIVEDQGKSLSDEHVKNLFSPFNLEGGGGSTELRSGFYTSELICERLGGDICCFADGPFSGNIYEFRVRVKMCKNQY